MKRGLFALGIVATTLSASQGNAEVCDYRLSHLIGRAGTAAAIGSTGVAAAGGAAFHAAGYYIIVHSVSGMAMIGSTAAGASAAGTVGIIAGTAGVLGTVGAIVAAPVTMLAAGVSAVGAGALEAGCYFTDERITDYDEVLAVLRDASSRMPPDQFRLVPARARRDYIVVLMGDDGPVQFFVENLYIVNGTLMHRDWGPNTEIGRVIAVR